jgi:hypothetical protein
MEQRAVLQVKRSLAVAQTNIAQIDAPGDWTLNGIRIESDKVSIGAASVFDVNKNGVTLFTDQTTRPRILAGASEVETGILAFAVAKGDKLSVDLDSVPASGIGENLQITLTFEDGEETGGIPTAHAASHKHGGSDEVAVVEPAANAIPKAGADGLLDPGWLPAGSGFDPDTILTEDGEVLVDDATGNVLIEG